MSKEGVGISNLELNKFTENSSNANLERNFAGVYLSHIIYNNLMRKRGHKSSFIISSTDRFDRPGMQW